MTSRPSLRSRPSPLQTSSLYHDKRINPGKGGWIDEMLLRKKVVFALSGSSRVVESSTPREKIFIQYVSVRLHVCKKCLAISFGHKPTDPPLLSRPSLTSLIPSLSHNTPKEWRPPCPQSGAAASSPLTHQPSPRTRHTQRPLHQTAWDSP